MLLSVYRGSYVVIFLKYSLMIRTSGGSFPGIQFTCPVLTCSLLEGGLELSRPWHLTRGSNVGEQTDGRRTLSVLLRPGLGPMYEAGFQGAANSGKISLGRPTSGQGLNHRRKTVT